MVEVGSGDGGRGSYKCLRHAGEKSSSVIMLRNLCGSSMLPVGRGLSWQGVLVVRKGAEKRTHKKNSTNIQPNQII